MFAFTVIKLISGLLSPISIVIILLSCLGFSLKKSLQRRVILILAGFLYLFNLRPVSHLFLYPLEQWAYTQEKIREEQMSDAGAIVVLGGGISTHGQWTRPRPTLDALSRVFKAHEVYLQFSEQLPVISSGGLGFPDDGIPPESLVMAEVMDRLQVKKNIAETQSKNTYENASETRKMLENKNEWRDAYPIVIVTSALHLPRATACFKKQGFNPIPVSSHYISSSEFIWDFKSFIPKSQYMAAISQALHEYLGLAFYKLAGRI